MVMTTKYAGVTITRGAEWQDNLTSATPDQWPEIIAEYQWYCRHVLPGDCRNLLRMVKEGEATDWAGYDDREIYLRDGLGLDPEAVDWALAGLRVTGVDAPVTLEQAKKLGRHGGDRRSDKVRANQVDNINLKHKGGTDPVYITAKLKRDHPHIADRLAAGEFRSARAAGIEAGIVKPTPTPPERVLIEWRRCTPEQRAALLPKLLVGEPTKWTRLKPDENWTMRDSIPRVTSKRRSRRAS